MDLIAVSLSGLFGSLHCVGMCGGFAGACSRRPGGLPLWHLGRIGSYAVLGALASSTGAVLPGPVWITAVIATLLLLWVALGIAGWLPTRGPSGATLVRIGSGLARSASAAAPLGFGVMNGLLPCGLVYSALAMAMVGRGAVHGALAMVAFGLGTVPALSLGGVGLRRVALASRARRRAFALLVLGTGVWYIWARALLVDPDGTRGFLLHCSTLFT